MSHVPTKLRRRVVERAKNRCEYCHLTQLCQEATFHVDHIVPRVDGGPTALENLALACVSCSLRKWAHTVALDPKTQRLAPLFNPRTQRWRNHFYWDGLMIDGLTPTGRATIAVLALNRPFALLIRSQESLMGRHPPPEFDE